MAQTVVNISMVGDKELERMLSKLTGKSQKKVVRPALKEIAKRAKDEAARRVPIETGKLREALEKQRVKVDKTKLRSDIRYSYDLPTRDLLDIDPGSKWYYPAHVEYGHGKVAARPYLRPAVDENYREFVRRIANLIMVGIPKEAARLAKK